MMLTCEQCGQPFEKPHGKGPSPKFCRPACRQAAFRARHLYGLARDRDLIVRALQSADPSLFDEKERERLGEIAVRMARGPAGILRQ
jgi:hypothetical protein